MNPIYCSMGTTIFEAMSARARANGAINLGQGFADGRGPEAVLEAAARAVLEKSNQYPPMAGLAELRQAVADHYARHQALNLAAEEVIVTSGATEALAAALFALIEPGDEVLCFQPLYDAYVPLIRRAGGVPRFVRLSPPEWRIERAALEAAATPKTRLILLNNPLNPAATMASAEDLAMLADFCVAHDLTAICDEVWEHVTFDGARHLPLIGFPGMRERTVKIGSAGKIFALTGFKVGWMCAAPPLARVVAKAHQFLTFTTPPNLQWAVAEGLTTQDDWVQDARHRFQAGRDRLAAGLRDAGFAVLPSAATYFLSVDLTASGLAMNDVTFSERLVDEAKVATIPVSAFYAEDPVTNVVRFCFVKEDAVLDEALARVKAWRAALS
ncbi:aminotransferase [Sphingomonas sp. ABOLD]|uniref:aspartate transaminase n=1 Tax=Sphingomonas trueperi TaxID=53317 RepID=A0A7X6BDB8_9SPHN|nr:MULTISPECIES: aminotransferase [Sphingomonas]NJB97547.1 aspartate/methionine/tyrosine aminotransferase [Sphingomonas trueperi]RSV43155.1 aminotransferase [Sphingomonas sp. ABOLE]RSV50034.1 aminotransferase [Sphingomonas sp. ABOLD]